MLEQSYAKHGLAKLVHLHGASWLHLVLLRDNYWL